MSGCSNAGPNWWGVGLLAACAVSGGLLAGDCLDGAADGGGAVVSIGPDTRKWLDELLADAADSARLTGWEGSFIGDVRDRLIEWGNALSISERQMEVLKRIEEKIYAAG